MYPTRQKTALNIPLIPNKMTQTFGTQIKNFLTSERITSVKNTGNPEHLGIDVKFGQLDIKDRGWNGKVELHTIQNSFLNRPLNIHNPRVLLDKIRYAIMIIAGVADIDTIPVSYIHTLEQYNVSPRLYMKDRGHIMHVLSNLAAIKLSADEWQHIVDLLGDCRGASRLEYVRDNINTTISTMTDTDAFSVKDMIGAEMNERLLDLDIRLRVSIESLENHVQEMDKINNSNNGWTPHNYGMLELRSLDSLITPMIDVDKIYNAVVKSNVLQSKEQFLRAREEWCQKNAGHEDEIVYYYAGAWSMYDIDEDFKTRWAAYEKVHEIPLRKKLYTTLYDNSENTESLLDTVNFIERVGRCPDWRRLAARITVIAGKQDKGTTNLKALTPAQQRSAMKYLDIIKVLAKKGKYGSNIPALVKLVVDKAISMIDVPSGTVPTDNPILLALKEDGTSASVRHDNFFLPLYEAVLSDIKAPNKTSRGARAAKTDKLAVLSGILAEADMEESFPVLDRVREDHYQITHINVATGDGFELGHIKAGTEFTEGNTFLQFKKDNKFRSAFDTQPTHWKDYMKWVTRIYKTTTHNTPEIDEAYQNTITFCTIMKDRLI